MKRTGIIGLLSALMFVLAAPCFAGERQGAFSVSPFVGGYTFDGVQHLDTAPVYGLRLGYDLTKHWEIEGVVDYLATDAKQSERSVNGLSYRLDVLYNLMPDGPLVPYLAIGGGGITFGHGSHFHGSNNPLQEGGDNTDATANAGFGIKYFLTDSIALRGDARQLFVFENHNSVMYNWEYTAGLTFLFGGNKPAARVVAAPPAMIEEEPLPPVPAAEPTADITKYCLTLDIKFDIDKAIIRDEYRDEIGRVAAFMQQYPTTTTVIEGHTDDVGSAEYNMTLSQKRAESVVNYLVEKFGIDRTRLSARGFGKTRPITDNTSDAGRQKNRRIEAIIDCALVDAKQFKALPDRLCLNLDVQFDTNMSDIKPQFNNEIAKVADYMKENPTVTALVEGHTDNVGSPAANMKLSQMRAESVVNYLVDKFGIDRSRLNAKGFGQTRRIAYNGTTEGRAKNRRVNVILDCVIKK
jgi:OOP family OmpA-OmpF porin